MKTIPKSLQVIFPSGPKPFKRAPATRASYPRFLSAIVVATFALGLSGCATTDGPKNQQRALVCPQCKMVAVRTVQPAANAQAGWSGNLRPTTVYEDQCPGCHGAIKTFFREGKWKHKCSVCQDSPYTCPVFHP